MIGSKQNFYKDLLLSLEAEIQQAFSQHDLLTYAGELNQYLKQYNIFASTSASTPTNIEYIQAEIIPFLRNQKNNISGTIYFIVDQVIQKQYCIAASHNQNDLSKFAQLLLNQAISAILVNQRSLIIYSAQVASQYAQQGDADSSGKWLDLWLGEYEEFLKLVQGTDLNQKGLLAVIGDLNTNIKNARNIPGINYSMSTSQEGTYIDRYVHRHDPWAGIDESEIQGTSVHDQDFDQQAQAWYNAEVNQAQIQVQEWCQNFLADEIISTITVALATWVEKIKPQTPTNTIKAVFDQPSASAQWKDTSRTVQYSVEFRNAIGSVKSAQGPSVTSTVGFAPTVSSIPVDSLSLTRTRIVWRTDTATGNAVAVKVFHDNTSTSFVDDGTAITVPL